MAFQAIPQHIRDEVKVTRNSTLEEKRRAESAATAVKSAIWIKVGQKEISRVMNIELNRTDN